MKTLVTNYTISGNDVTLVGINCPLEAIVEISDATTGALFYSPRTGGIAHYTQGNNSVVTLKSTPGAHDNLQILWEDVASSKVPGFSLPAYDAISCSYTDGVLTGVTYKRGGTTVATMTLAYDVEGKLISVSKA